METKRLYRDDVYRKIATMTLSEISHKDGKSYLIFDETIFFPTSGGQLCDLGSIEGYELIDVTEKDGIVTHVIKGDCDLKVGAKCEARLDWDRRFDHMQMHTGEHMISGAFYKLFGGVNKGFHMGDDYVTIDIELAEGFLDREMVREAERLANRWIWADKMVSTVFCPTLEDAKSLKLRKEPKFGEDLFVVVIGDETDPYDVCCCCGTHTSTTGQVGMIKVTHMEKNKSMTRLYVKIGRAALNEFDFRQDLTDQIALGYSCDVSGIVKAIDKDRKRAQSIYTKYSKLKAMRINDVIRILEEKLAGSDFVEYSDDSLELDELNEAVTKLSISDDKLLVLLDKEAKSMILVSSGKLNVADLIKANRDEFNIKGGGRANNARAIFASLDDLDEFIKKIH